MLLDNNSSGAGSLVGRESYGAYQARTHEPALTSGLRFEHFTVVDCHPNHGPRSTTWYGYRR